MIFSDGNKTVASLLHVATVFTAEVVGLKLAAKLVEGHSSAEKFLVCSDSLNVLQKIRNVLTNDHLVQREFFYEHLSHRDNSHYIQFRLFDETADAVSSNNLNWI